MADQPRLDLRSLADVDSPDVVRAALASFRRRVIVRSLWALLALLVGVAAIFAFASPHNLRARIEGASLIASPSGAVWDVAGARVVLLEVVHLGPAQVGLHLVAAPDPKDPASYGLVLAGTTQSETLGNDQWFEVAVPANGRITVRVSRDGGCKGPTVAACRGSFTIDLAALHVSHDIWR